MTDPGAPLTGTVTLAATAADAHSGVASVVFQVGPSATGTFRDLCTARSQPFNCQADTTGLPYGSTFFRAVVTDRAGNTTTSAPVGPRLVDNTTRSVTLADPGMFLEGTVTLTASPAASAGITSVSFQQRRTGTTAWTVICTPTAAPWTCDWDTRTVADGRYDVRAVLVDANGNEAVSEVATSRLVDNVTTPFRGVDVQTTNGGRAGEVDRGDTLVHTFSRRVDLGTITPGWDGTPLPVRLEVRDSGAFTDDVVITRPGPTVNLGHVRVTAGLIGLFHSHATFEATLVASTETVDGLPRTVVTVRVGSLVSGGTRDMTFSSDMTWHPVAAVRSLGSQALDTSAVAESGSKDRDF
ncbi:Ig-like domain-containing protein [Nocardioides sp. TF02-7]|nr:Ig-like domain-containing protein [Nocardioides sp. TF02-7]